MRIKLRIALLVFAGALAGYWNSTSKDPEIFAQEKSVAESQRMPAAIDIEKQPDVSILNDKISPGNVISKISSRENGELPRPEVVQKFKIIHDKVFKNEQDLKNLKLILVDSQYILQLGEYLRDLKSLDKEEFKINQNVVIDILIEALKSGDVQAAGQAIMDIVKDAQVEDEKIGLKTREVLGGVKADLLYQSTSIRPELSDQFVRLLPGPVSQKIWQNVQQQQADNLKISEAELQNRNSQKSQ